MCNRKNEPGMPRLAIMKILQLSQVESLDRVVLATKFIHRKEWYKTQGHWMKPPSDYYLNKITWPIRKRFSPYYTGRLDERKKELRSILITVPMLYDLPKEIDVVEHHTAHAASAYYGSHYGRDDAVAILTADGSGDGLSSTVATNNSDGSMTRLAASTRNASLGKIYSTTTLLMGFKPWEHEYKLMGMAPYSKPDQEALDKLCEIINVRKGRFVENYSSDWAYSILKTLYTHKSLPRICSALQIWFETMVIKWMNSLGDLFDKDELPTKYAFAGGNFMNVKGNMLISQMPQVDDMFITPSAGDESTCIGAAWQIVAEDAIAHGLHPKDVIEPFGAMYLGTEAMPEHSKELRNNKDLNVEIVKNPDELIGNLLSEGNIVARCSGRTEFGARALGNRSILAPADNYRIVDRLNASIKHRDFWMPFTPSILYSNRKILLENPKDIYAPYMITCFPATDVGKSELEAALHPWDKTMRPQMVKAKDNGGYYKVLKQYNKRTGCSGFLNTSFNLHGSPIVNDVETAIHTLLNSGLENLVVDNLLITKA